MNFIIFMMICIQILIDFIIRKMDFVNENGTTIPIIIEMHFIPNSIFMHEWNSDRTPNTHMTFTHEIGSLFEQ